MLFDESKTLDDAYVIATRASRSTNESARLDEAVGLATRAVTGLSAPALKDLSPEQVEAVSELRDALGELIENRNKLLST